MLEHLFTYGTLAPGRPNDHILRGIEGTWETAFARGFLREEGWGAEMGFPGIVLDESGDEVQGHLFSSAELHEHWPRLDAFEGEAYKRIIANVRRIDKTIAAAHIYVLA